MDGAEGPAPCESAWTSLAVGTPSFETTFEARCSNTFSRCDAAPRAEVLKELKAEAGAENGAECIIRRKRTAALQEGNP